MYNYDTLKYLLGRHNGTFFSITFVKKDGTERTVTVQQDAARTNAKGAEASPSAQAGVATRAVNNPNLYNVWSVKQGYRSVNLNTVTRVAMRGTVYQFDKTSFIGFDNAAS